MFGKNTAYCFLTGAVGYPALELIVRGRTHWSMALAGVICLAGIHRINQRMHGKKLALRAAAGALLITTVEFAVGLMVNCALGWNVWDYSDRPLNLLGQVCPSFTGIWFGLCLGAFSVLDRIEEHGKNVAQNA